MTISELEEYKNLTAIYYELQQSSSEETKAELKRVKRRLAAISDFILSCQDPMIKQLMLLRFTRFLSWDKIAISLGGLNSADGCRMMVYRYINRENRKNKAHYSCER